MRVKNTLFTAIAAGIIFLSGMVILGKNTLMKKHVAKKDYILVPAEETDATQEKRTEDLLHKKQEQLQQVSQKEEQLLKTAEQMPNDERIILLQMVNKLVKDRTTGKVNYTVSKAIRKHEGKHTDQTNQVVGLILTHQEKMVHRIREPSELRQEKSGLEIVSSDKGG